MKRWIAAFVAALFLSTATLHVFAHHGEVDAGCAACHVQRGALPAASAPAVVRAPLVSSPLAAPVVPSVRSARVAASAARAPPVLPA